MLLDFYNNLRAVTLQHNSLFKVLVYFMPYTRHFFDTSLHSIRLNFKLDTPYQTYLRAPLPCYLWPKLGLSF